MKRDNSIDCAKGIAIILVVIGHLLNPINGIQLVVYNAIYSCHMALFFLISGMVHKKLCEEYFVKTIVRTFNYIVPYVIWTFISLIMTNSRIDYWFLVVIAILNVLSAIENYIWMWLKNNGYLKNDSFRLIIDGVFICVSLLIKYIMPISGLGSLWYWWLFFVLGKQFQEKIGLTCFKQSPVLLVLELVLFVVGIIFYRTSEVPLFYRLLPFKVGSMIIVEIYRILLALLGIAIVLQVAYILREMQILQYLGRHTIHIYILHLFFLQELSVNSKNLKILLIIVFSIVGCVVVDKCWLVDAILFGRITRINQYITKRKS